MPCLKVFAAAAFFAIAASPLPAQQSTGHVALNVVALDPTGRPISDLTLADFKVFDNGARQSIASLRLNQAQTPPPMVILFDLLNSNLVSRGAVGDAVKTALSGLPSTGELYLYLLAEDGSLFPVHSLDASPDAAWTRDIGPLLDGAMRQTVQVKPQDFRPASPIALPARFRTTCTALDRMRAAMESSLRGPKQLLWVTYGFPSTIRFAGQGWWDGGPTLRELGAHFMRSGITMYTADPGINLDRGILDRDALDILTGATGGQTFSTIALDRAISQARADAGINYSLEYAPASGNWDGKYHKLRVTVDRKGVKLRTESGYFAVHS
jgi:VWFA-related protein